MSQRLHFRKLLSFSKGNPLKMLKKQFLKFLQRKLAFQRPKK